VVVKVLLIPQTCQLEVQTQYFLLLVHLAVVLVNLIVHQHQIKMVVLVVVDHIPQVQELELQDKAITAVVVDLVGVVVEVEVLVVLDKMHLLLLVVMEV
jgi:hypothetical protein